MSIETGEREPQLVEQVLYAQLEKACFDVHRLYTGLKETPQQRLARVMLGETVITDNEGETQELEDDFDNGITPVMPNEKQIPLELNNIAMKIYAPFARNGVPYGLRKNGATTYEKAEKRAFENMLSVRSRRLWPVEAWATANIIKDIKNRADDGYHLGMGVLYKGSDGTEHVTQVWELDSISQDPYKVAFCGNSCRLDRDTKARKKIVVFLYIMGKAIEKTEEELRKSSGSL